MDLQTSPRTTRRGFLKAGALLAAAYGLSSSPLRAQGQARAEVFRWAPHADLSLVDPLSTTAYITQIYSALVFDQLFGLDADYQPQLQMAQSHEVSDDGLTHVIALRPGLKFHDGSDVTGADVKASVERWMRMSGEGKSVAPALRSLTAEGQTVTFAMTTPFPLLPALLGRPQAPCVILPKAQAEAEGRIDRPVGSGPYQLVWDEWVQGAQVIFQRFEGYVPREGEPQDDSYMSGPKVAYIDRIEWKIIPDAATAVAAIQSGELDGIETVATDFLPIMEMMPNINTYRSDVPAVGIMLFNQLHPPFDDVRVRQAVLRAVKQTDFMGAIGWTPGNEAFSTEMGAFVPGTPMASDRGMEAVTGEHDLEAAKAEIAAAGFAGAKISLIDVVQIPMLHAIALVAADLFGKLGFEVEVDAMDWGAALKKRVLKGPVEEGGWSVFFTALLGLSNLDPISHLALRGNGEDGPIGWHSNPKIEELRNAWFAAQSQEERVALAADLQGEMFRSVPYIPLGAVYTFAAVTDEWANFQTEQATFFGLRPA